MTLNAEMAMQAEQNQDLANIIKKAELVIPDGSGVILYLWLQGYQQRRCPGIELAESLLCQAGQLESCPVFMFGGGAWSCRDGSTNLASKTTQISDRWS